MRSTLNFKTITLLLLAVAAAFGLLPHELLLLSVALTTETGAGAAPESTGPSEGSALGTGTPAAGSGGSSPASGAANPGSKQPPLSRAARAHERATAKLAEPTKNTPTTTDGQQAPGGALAAGASTESKGAAGPTSADTKPADGEGGKAAAPASTELTAPQDWPKDRQEAFNKLPPEARAIELSFHKEMQSAFTRTMTQLAEQSKNHQEAIDIGKQFAADPKATIAHLAQRAGLEIFFERTGPEDTMPDDVRQDPEKYAKWIADKAVRDATRAIEQRNAADKAKADEAAQAEAVAKAGEDLQKEIADAMAAHADFSQHKPAVVALLQRTQGGLSVEEAYRLTTFDAMVKLVDEGAAAKRELATLKGEATRRAKDATRPPTGTGPGTVSGEDKMLSLGARAAARAEKRLATRTVG